jgi:hypothetical protein
VRYDATPFWVLFVSLLWFLGVCLSAAAVRVAVYSLVAGFIPPERDFCLLLGPAQRKDTT